MPYKYNNNNFQQYNISAIHTAIARKCDVFITVRISYEATEVSEKKHTN